MSTSETDRLAALRRYRILDTEPERGFDDLTHLASHICGTPIALITLVDENRQWFKSRVGLTVTETSRSISMCARAIEQPDVFVIPDALEDRRFRDNPLVVGEPHVRFYAGAPLITPDGHALGTLCVADRVPRRLTADQLEALLALKRQVEMQLELRRNLTELEQALAGRDEAEAGKTELISHLRSALDNLNRLASLMPYCSNCQLNMVVPADPAAIPKVTDGVVHMLTEKHWSEAEIMRVELALQEALANAIRHGCRNDVTQQVQCIVTIDGANEITIVVRDPGTGFDPKALPDPLAEENLLKSRGRGVFLINELMDDVAFSDGGRQVEMRRRNVEGRALPSAADALPS
jgi:anti-sigma regulatory factor (Ser/Thr protein kinase)